MDEIEKRLAAVELLLIEVSPWLQASVLEDAAAAIRAGLNMGAMSQDEVEIRSHALQLLTDGRQRYQPGSVGRWIRGGD